MAEQQYIDKLIYGSSQNGINRTYNLRDRILQNTITVEKRSITDAATAFYEKAHHGFGSEYSENTIKFNTAAAAIKSAMIHWKKCT